MECKKFADIDDCNKPMSCEYCRRFSESSVLSGYAIQSYYISTKPVAGICKQKAIFAEVEVNGATGKHYRQVPLIYLQKPKWISEDSFLEIVKSLQVTIEKGFRLS